MAASLGTMLGGFAATLAAGTLALTIGYGLDFLDRQGNAQRDEIIRVRTAAAADEIARMLANDWAAIRFVGGQIPGSPPERIRGMLDTLALDGTRVAWAGYASARGRVDAAARDMAVGADVSELSWFAAGMQGPFGGDLHEIGVLEAEVGGDQGPPPRFLDLAVPVVGEGQPLGVAALQIRESWLDAYLARLAKSLRIDLFLLSRDGRVVFSSAGDFPRDGSLQSARAAATGEAVTVREIWPDGGRYDVSVVPSVATDDLPDFGWRMLGRLSADAPIGQQVTSTAGLPWLAGLLIFAAALTAIFVRFITRPFTRLAAFGSRLADSGAWQAGYPPHERTTRESAALSSALARLDRG